MDDTGHHSQPTGWRTSKACQECRKRKIKCNGINPCKTCQLRNTPCVYRDWIRHRKKKHQEKSESEEFSPNGATRAEYGVRASSPGFVQPSSSAGRRNPNVNYTTNSVSATDTTSSSSEIQLYYGSTSHFALMHEIYRDLVSNPGNYSKAPQAEVEEASAGIDMFSFRRIFFGTPVGPHDALKSLNATDVPVMFLPYELARLFLERFLSTLLHLVPFRSKDSYRRELEQLYHRAPGASSDTWSRCMLLMAMAMGSLGTEHYSWGDVLFERVKTTAALSDDVVNLRTVQISLLMISLTQLLRGRPRSLLQRDIGIEPPRDPLLRVLYDLTKMMSRSADEMFGRHHDSLLHLWKLARSITDDHRSYDSKVQETLGFGLEKGPQPGEIGVRQVMLVTLWLNDACNQVIGAAYRTIHFLYEASFINNLVRECRYHGYFLSSAAFALIYDLMHGDELASSHLRWIHATLQCLSSMRAGDPIASSMSAIQTVLRKLNPSYEWQPPATVKGNGYGYDSNTVMQQSLNNASNNPGPSMSELFSNNLAVGGGLPALSNMQGSFVPGNFPPPSASAGSGEDLLDLTLSDMGWDFDFSTMDLETFFSIYPNMDTPTA
ncbi:conserved hypothetical protein [Aspergillus terreus NIH2624]|uniref:Zn(2)-C6 fungal-type domain-containing protein n=1 Tax=Aspergillus terreus (strain NIH 2624 / FGSC A1156) TaxID=341663 RepID=Q0CG69_ASPTN|nr:uncharacterized protein ATEG_07323 [Aspergillus terreus NIH2624]EAU32707.1 conserved hypothetical protein [Aspergillus terreus NIH2624]